ncbi:hypothetical protein AVEN_205835-1, partial [Araneus ventricosus]
MYFEETKLKSLAEHLCSITSMSFTQIGIQAPYDGSFELLASSPIVSLDVAL